LTQISREWYAISDFRFYQFVELGGAYGLVA